MTLPSSGAISFDNLRTERAVGGAISLGDMYREGSKTPVSPGTSGIPTAGAISMSNFYGKTLYGSNFITFVASTGITDGKVAGQQGYAYGSVDISVPGGSTTTGTLEAGNGVRLIMSGLTTLSGISGVTSGNIHGVVDQATPVAASNSSDYVGSANTTQMQDRVVKIYSGTGTGGTLLGQMYATTQSSSPVVMTSGNPFLNASANQDSVVKLSMSTVNSSGTTIGSPVGFPALTNGSTYTVQIN
jgi:hypothetical protein